MAEELGLRLRPNEARLLELIEDFSRSSLSPTEKDIRVAGGWVRDHLLRLDCDDLDIALEDCTGSSFAKGLEMWLYETHLMKEVDLVVLPANPEKSKHLETAILNLKNLNLSVDFVNLRAESYTTDSRVPDKVRYGSPKEDAYRRDFTINSLFYVINKRQIEDWTGVGMSDLQSKVLQTPVDALETFLDDPLRLIRAARFLSKLPQFKPHQSIMEAARSTDLIQALNTKISPERIRSELQKVFTYEEPFIALSYLMEWKIIPHIFQVTADVVRTAVRNSVSNGFLDKFGEEELLSYDYGFSILKRFEEDLKEIRANSLVDCVSTDSIFWSKASFQKYEVHGAFAFAVLLLVHREFKANIEGKSIALTDIALDNIKSRGLLEPCKQIHSLIFSFVNVLKSNPEIPRESLIQSLRLEGSRRYWDLALLIACSIVHSSSAIVECQKLQALIHDRYNLTGVWNAEPLLDGQRVMALTNAKGKKVGDIMKFQVQWICERWDPDDKKRQALVPELESILIKTFS